MSGTVGARFDRLCRCAASWCEQALVLQSVAWFVEDHTFVARESWGRMPWSQTWSAGWGQAREWRRREIADASMHAERVGAALFETARLLHGLDVEIAVTLAGQYPDGHPGDHPTNEARRQLLDWYLPRCQVTVGSGRGLPDLPRVHADRSDVIVSWDDLAEFPTSSATTRRPYWERIDSYVSRYASGVARPYAEVLAPVWEADPYQIAYAGSCLYVAAGLLRGLAVETFTQTTGLREDGWTGRGAEAYFAFVDEVDRPYREHIWEAAEAEFGQAHEVGRLVTELGKRLEEVIDKHAQGLEDGIARLDGAKDDPWGGLTGSPERAVRSFARKAQAFVAELQNMINRHGSAANSLLLEEIRAARPPDPNEPDRTRSHPVEFQGPPAPPAVADSDGDGQAGDDWR